MPFSSTLCLEHGILFSYRSPSPLALTNGLQRRSLEIYPRRAAKAFVIGALSLPLFFFFPDTECRLHAAIAYPFLPVSHPRSRTRAHSDFPRLQSDAPAVPGSGCNWVLGAVAYLVCWVLWIIGVFLGYEVFYSYYRRWRLREYLKLGRSRI
jgi:hypothetical protein